MCEKNWPHAGKIKLFNTYGAWLTLVCPNGGTWTPNGCYHSWSDAIYLGPAVLRQTKFRPLQPPQPPSQYLTTMAATPRFCPLRSTGKLRSDCEIPYHRIRSNRIDPLARRHQQSRKWPRSSYNTPLWLQHLPCDMTVGGKDSNGFGIGQHTHTSAKVWTKQKQGQNA